MQGIGWYQVLWIGAVAAASQLGAGPTCFPGGQEWVCMTVFCFHA